MGKGKGKAKPKGKVKPAAKVAKEKPLCRHLGSAVVPELFTSPCSLDACSACARDDVELLVCCTCAAVLCKRHCKSHWAQAKSAHCVFMDEDGAATCWECEVSLGPSERLAALVLAVTGEAPKPATSTVAAAVASQAAKSAAAPAPSGGKASSSRGSTAGVHGLVNLGNSCYFNATVQALATLFGAAPTLGRGKLHAALTDTLHAARASDERSRTFNPNALFSAVRSVAPQFRGGQQQDAHELFLSLVDALRTEHKLGVARAFVLETASIVTCHTCRTSYPRCEEAYDLSVEVDESAAASGKKNSKRQQQQQQQQQHQQQQQQQAVSDGDTDTVVATVPWVTEHQHTRLLPPDLPRLVDADVPRLGGAKAVVVVPPATAFRQTASGLFDCRPSAPSPLGDCALLASYTAPERLEGDDAYACATCARARTATKQILLAKLPMVLVLHLKRFKQTVGGRMTKIDSLVPFPDALDVSPYCVPGVVKGPEDALYRLRALVVHEGKDSLRSGHYIAVVSSTKRDRWFEVSDTRVQALSSEAHVHSYKAFMLFYQRQEAPAPSL